MAGDRKRYLFTGGGTGGHVTPNLAILSEVRALGEGADFLYVGSARGYETRVQEGGIPFRSIACAAFTSPRHPLAFLRMALRISWGILQSLFIVIRFRPHVVVASGGYVSVPVVIAAWLARRRIYVHEQNVAPGLATRFLAHLATRVGVTFRETMDRFPSGKTVHAGYPVRRQIQEGSSQRARDRFHIPENRKVAFILGGSMGSRAINRGTVEALESLLAENQDITIIHATGLNASGEYRAYEDTRDRLRHRGLGPNVPGRYVCKPFFNDIQDVYALASLVVARAGAGTIMELAAVGKPSILIPKSDVPGDHQLMNAMSLKKTGSAEVLFEERGEEEGRPITRVRGDVLARKIIDLMGSEEELTRMGRRAHRLTVNDALAVHTGIVQELASGIPLVRTVVETDRVGLLLDESGQAHDLLFHRNTVGTGPLHDIVIPSSAGRGRAVILRRRRGGSTEYELFARGGSVQVAGAQVGRSVALKTEDVLSIGGQRLTFLLRDRPIERTVSTGGMGMKVVATGLGTLTSRLFGFVRSVVMAAVFGLGNVTDLFILGFTVANFLRGVFAEMAVDTAFLPTFVHLQRTGRTREANRLYSTVLSVTVVVSGAVTVAGILTLPAWLPLLGGLSGRGLLAEGIQLTAIMMPYLVLVSTAAVMSAVLKACNHFAVPAFSSIMFNVGILAGVCLYPLMGLPALGVGVILGGLGQIAFQLPVLLSAEVRQGFGLTYQPRAHLRDPGVRKVARVFPNVFADAAIQKLGSVVDIVLALPMAAGMVSALAWAMVIFRLPFGLISQSINTVVLKELSEGQALKDPQWTRRLLAGGINWTVFTLLPVSVVLIVLAEPIVNLLFGFGNFDAKAAAWVTTALRFYAIGLVGWGLTGLCGRFFSARMEQNRGTLTSLATLVLNVVVSVALVKAGMGLAGLALGTSIAFSACAALRLGLLSRSLRREGIPLRAADVLPGLGQTLVATAGALVAIFVVHAAVHDFQGFPGFLNRLFLVAVPAGFGAFAFIAAALLLGSEPLDEILARLGRGRARSAARAEPRPVNPYCIDPPGRLLSWVRRNTSTRGGYNFSRRVTTFLRARDWRTRNVGVKLVGELTLKSFRYELCELLTGREPAPLSHRVLGGDFVQPGFLRRNAVEALEKLQHCDPPIERALLMALGDPYYEVRTQAARVLGVFSPRLGGPAREEATVLLSRLSRERNFEVAMEAVTALGEVAQDDGVVDVFRSLHYHRNWQVRDRVVKAYGRLLDRGVLDDRARLLTLLDDVLATSEGFIPRFVLKEDMNALQRRLVGAGQEHAGGGAADRGAADTEEALDTEQAADKVEAADKEEAAS